MSSSVDVMEKYCPSCKEIKDIIAFNKHAKRADGLQSVCKQCHKSLMNKWYLTKPNEIVEKTNEYRRNNLQKYKEYTSNWRADHVEEAQLSSLKSKCAMYGITTEEYDRILNAQNGRCKACGIPPTTRALSIDHDHSCCPGKKSCGKCIRGLLCTSCNWALGQVQDDVVRSILLAEYLEDYNGRL